MTAMLRVAANQVRRTVTGIGIGRLCTGSNSTPIFLAPTAWRLCSSSAKRASEYGTRHRAYDDLIQHDGVATLCLHDGVVLIVPASRSEFGLLSRAVDLRTLREYLENDCGYAPNEVPSMKIVSALPNDDQVHCPFLLQHVLESLFRALDTDGNGTISMEEFAEFCHTYDIFSGNDNELRSAFRAADHQTLKSFGGQELDIGEFKDLLFNTGLLESRTGQVAKAGGAYLFDRHIVDIVLRYWFNRYDVDGDGSISFKEYCRLVADFQLPYAVSRQGFDEVDMDGNGSIDMDEFKALLMDAKIVATGLAISRNEDEEGLRKTWRALEDTQAYLPPTAVYSSADELPPQEAGVVRFVCVSDTHGHHRDLTEKIPPGDVLLHAGDFSMCGEISELVDFGKWLKELPFAMKIVIAGNHDLTLDAQYGLHEDPGIVDAARAALLQACGDSMVYLQDEMITYQGVRIFGSPWQPAFGSWAFNLPRGEALARKWRNIPEGVDVLLVHGPPMGRGDSTDMKHVGCAGLLDEIQNRVRPAFCVSGHIHEPGCSFDGVTHYVSASSCDEDYECVHAPQVFDIPMSRPNIANRNL